MRSTICLAMLGVCVLTAQTPNLSGVWKANVEKSKFAGPPPANSLMIIDQQGSKLSEKVLTTTQRGEQRASYTFNTDGKPSFNSFMGMPMQAVGSVDGGTLVINAKIAGPHPGSGVIKLTLSPDGNTLTQETTHIMGERQMQETVVWEKQPDSAGEALRQPEQTAGAHYKNVKVLKDMPSSDFIALMQSFNWQLGVGCDFCHTPPNFAADEKPAKEMARKMMTMTHNINQQFFDGKAEVRCYTCHQGKSHPQSRPSFQ